jgi:methylenetetrahydrofolate dehydrogenase (NADP+)/methenyltetrahydrofolate cyclohydrolase
MPAHLLLGKTSADQILRQIKHKLSKTKQKPCLAVILVGQNHSSVAYIRIKERACQRVGIKFQKHFLPTNASTNQLIKLIKKINRDNKIQGLIVQLPLPKNIKTHLVTAAISPKKDLDGFVVNSNFISPVYQGVFFLIKRSKIKLAQKKAIILANSQIFAQPLQKMFQRKGVAISAIVLPKQKLLTPIKKADIIITALGQAHFLKPKMIKSGCLIIDVGFSRLNHKLAGDVDPRCAQRAGHLSPVPGGIGPLTVAFLLKNLIKK